jgi:hypothetical protein
MLLAAAAVDLRGVARHDEAIADRHRLHLCDDYVGRCRFQCTRQLILLLFGQQHTRTPTEVRHSFPMAARSATDTISESMRVSASIDIHFYFDNVSASFDGYQRILDFKNRTSDSGLYSLNGFLVVICFRLSARGPISGICHTGFYEWHDGRLVSDA